MKILENVLISSLTTMRLGGAARYVIQVEKMEDIPAAYAFAEEKNLPVFVLGGGANTIGRDEGFRGVIIIDKLTGVEIDALNGVATALGGTKWDDFVEQVCEVGLSGVEALSKIPGTVGAAPVQNIGAYGQDVSQTIREVLVYDTKEKTFLNLQNSECVFSYRKSIFNSGMVGRYFIAQVTFDLKKNKMQPPFYRSLQNYLDENEISDYSPMNIRQAVSTIRANKLPDPEKIASSGSFFKNVFLDKPGADATEANGIPVYRDENGNGKINSGWLIEQAGLSGKILHGMRVNEKAALVLINESAKTYADLAAARSEIIEIVKSKFGLVLEQEPVEI